MRSQTVKTYEEFGCLEVAQFGCVDLKPDLILYFCLFLQSAAYDFQLLFFWFTFGLSHKPIYQPSTNPTPRRAPSKRLAPTPRNSDKMFFQMVTHSIPTCCMIFVGTGYIPSALFNTTPWQNWPKMPFAIAEIATEGSAEPANFANQRPLSLSRMARASDLIGNLGGVTPHHRTPALNFWSFLNLLVPYRVHGFTRRHFSKWL